MHLIPVTLSSPAVRLEPLSLSHLSALCRVGLDATLLQWFSINPITTEQAMRAFIERALEEQSRGESLPFATIDAATGTVVGSTRYMAIDQRNKHVEIGATWIARPWQRTHINTHAKLLMLTHAFEALGCARVELKTDALNTQSRTAIRRLGATEEGTFRKHMLCQSGRWRDTVYFSIIDTEWPAIKSGLQARLDAFPSRAATA